MTSMGRASALIGAGTIVSRLSGFLRTIVLVAALGSTTAAGNAFTIANQLPNNIYAIISTGILTAVIVPQIVRSASHKDGGSAFVSKLLTLGTIVLLVATALAMLFAPQLVQLYGVRFSADQRTLATAFAYWCLPQVFFYGAYSLFGETLNARKVFGPFTWAPIVNNLVSIAGFGVFILIFGSAPNTWTPTMVALIGGTATLGIAVQAVILMFFWRRAGLQLRPDFQWRGVGMRHIGRLAGWTFLMVAAGQVAGLIQTTLLPPEGSPGAFATANAWLLFMLPYSIIVLSIGTPYFTRLSEHAVAGRDDDVRADISRSIRTLGVFIVIATAALAVAAVPASRIFSSSAEKASAAAPVLLAYLVGLVPLAVLFVVQRSFYAYNDTRTPFFFTLVQCTLVVGTTLIAHSFLHDAQLAAGIAIGQSFASLVQVIIATWLLHRRLGGIGTASWLRALGRFVLAAIPAAAVGWAVYMFLLGGPTGWTSSGQGITGQLLGALGAAIVGLVCLAMYVGILALFRAPELNPAMDMARRLIRR